jgi:hypothetical protein
LERFQFHADLLTTYEIPVARSADKKALFYFETHWGRRDYSRPWAAKHGAWSNNEDDSRLVFICLME